jgi:hypothetical protein
MSLRSAVRGIILRRVAAPAGRDAVTDRRPHATARRTVKGSRDQRIGMGLFDRLADLPVVVEGYDLFRRERETPEFTRVTTTFRLHGDGETGRGEDVCYDEADHEALHADPPAIPTGEYTFAGFSAALDDAELFPEPPDRHHAPAMRRWAVESAALDLALRQQDTDLGSALGRSYDPVRFVVSTRLGDEGFGRIERLLDANPDLEFKLDPTPEWSAALIDRLADLDRVRVLDLKALYEDTDVDGSADPEFYREIAGAFPEAILEDAKVTPETRPVLEPERDRLSWDYPITGLESVRELPFEPSVLNVKPSRFGTVESVLDTVEWALDEGITLYAGGQFELGVGRRHGQALASLCYPDAPNDISPTGYHGTEPDPDAPTSPIEPPAEPRGIWE